MKTVVELASYFYMYEHYIKVDLELWKSIFKGLEVSNLICWGQVKLLQYWSLKFSITNW